MEFLCSSFQNIRDRINLGVYPQGQAQCLQGEGGVNSNGKAARSHLIEVEICSGTTD